MRARHLIGSASFSPDALKVITQAFDDAWDELAPSVSARADAIEAARLSLANIVLSLARDGPSYDAPLLTQEAVRVFKMKHPIAS